MDSKTRKIQPDQNLKYYNHAKQIVQNRMSFFMHLLLYFTVNLPLIVCNIMKYQGLLWSVWIAIFWGCGMIGHFAYVYLFMDLFSKNPMQAERFEKRTTLYVHIIVYILINLSLVVCNRIYSPDIFWAIYPILGWGVGLFYHFFFTAVFRGMKIKKWKQEKTIQLMKKYYALDPFKSEE